MGEWRRPSSLLSFGEHVFDPPLVAPYRTPCSAPEHIEIDASYQIELFEVCRTARHRRSLMQGGKPAMLALEGCMQPVSLSCRHELIVACLSSSELFGLVKERAIDWKRESPLVLVAHCTSHEFTFCGVPSQGQKVLTKDSIWCSHNL